MLSIYQAKNRKEKFCPLKTQARLMHLDIDSKCVRDIEYGDVNRQGAFCGKIGWIKYMAL
jgi:hypothetical protein